jgi:hypothetical protein
VFDRKEDEKTRSIVLCAMCLLNVIVYGGKQRGRSFGTLSEKSSWENWSGLTQPHPKLSGGC